jgi:DNA-binding beta-propeller fold protein YncE
VLGYFFDNSARALRPILGIPRAAAIGSPFESGFSMQSAVVSSRQSYALAISSDGGVRIADLNGAALGGKLSWTDLPVVGRAGAVYLSPRGSAAAILTDKWLGFATGMSAGAAQVTGLALDTQPIAAAVTDDGTYLLAALPDGSLLLVGRDGTRSPLAMPAPISRIAFRPGSADAIAVSEDNRLWLIQQAASSAVVTQIAGPDDGLSSPVGIGFLPDGKRAALANSNGVILTVDVVAGAKSSIACSCNPTRFEPMAAPGVFRLTERAGQPQYMFDSSSLQTFFVPAAPLNELRGKGPSERRPRD